MAGMFRQALALLDPPKEQTHSPMAAKQWCWRATWRVAQPTKPRSFSVPLIRPIAARLNFDEDYLLTLAVHEHGWVDAHNDRLHNLFGTTQAGGSNLAYASDEAAAQSWEAHYGGGGRGSKSMTEFVAHLRAMGYNSKDPDYDHKTAITYAAIVKHKAACGVK